MHLSSKSASDFHWHVSAVSFSTMRKERICLTPLPLSAVTVVLLLFFTLWLIASSVHPSEKSFFLPSPLPLPASFPRDVLELPPLSLCFSMHNELVTKMVVQQWTLPWQLAGVSIAVLSPSFQDNIFSHLWFFQWVSGSRQLTYLSANFSTAFLNDQTPPPYHPHQSKWKTDPEPIPVFLKFVYKTANKKTIMKLTSLYEIQSLLRLSPFSQIASQILPKQQTNLEGP